MRLRWADLNESDREAFRATFAFLNGRLEERATVDLGHFAPSPNVHTQAVGPARPDR